MPQNKVEKLGTELDDLERKLQEFWDYLINPGYIQHKLVGLEDRS